MTALYVVVGLWLVVGCFLTTLVLWLVYMPPIKLAFIFKKVIQWYELLTELNLLTETEEEQKEEAKTEE